MKRYCLTLDLREDELLIREYITYHQAVWPEVKQSLRDAGILDMEIYLHATHLFMILEAVDSFSFERKAEMDRANPKVMEWEQRMARFQKVDPAGDAVTRWQQMQRVFSLAQPPAR